MPVRIFNSLTRGKEELTPLRAGELRIYVCGVTVYDLSHIGHARSAIVFDVIEQGAKIAAPDVFNLSVANDWVDTPLQDGPSLGPCADIAAFTGEVVLTDCPDSFLTGGAGLAALAYGVIAASNLAQQLAGLLAGVIEPQNGIDGVSARRRPVAILQHPRPCSTFSHHESEAR